MKTDWCLSGRTPVEALWHSHWFRIPVDDAERGKGMVPGSALC